MSNVTRSRHGLPGSPPVHDADRGRSPWVIGIIVGFVIVVLVNIAFITIAVKGADTVVPSYETTKR